MTSGDPSTYVLTVRPHRSADGCFEYIVSRPGALPVLSEVPYPTYEAAKAAGERVGRDLGLTAAPSTSGR